MQVNFIFKLNMLEKGIKVQLLANQKLNLQDTFQAAGVWSPGNGGQITEPWSTEP